MGDTETRAAAAFAAEIADLRSRLERLERGTTLSHSSIEGGGIDIYDDAGQYRGRVGMLPDGTSGFMPENGPVPGQPTPPLVTTRSGLAFAWWGTSSRINYAPDPSFESADTAGWVGTGGVVLGPVSGNSSRGTYALGVRWTAAGTVTRSLDDMALVPGEFYTVAIDVFRGTGPHVELTVSGDTDVASTAAGSRVAVTFRMGSSPPLVTLRPSGDLGGGESWLDMWAVTPGTVAGEYFDGDMPGYQWLGSPHRSPTVATEGLPSNVTHAQVHADPDPEFMPTEDTFRGAIVPGGGALPFPLPVGVLYFVKVVLVTNDGQFSPPSEGAPVRVKAIDGVDIADRSIDWTKIGEGAIRESNLGFSFDVAGGITITYARAPHLDPGLNDQWWDAGNGYRPSRWDGDSWEPMQFGTDALAAGSVTTALLAAGAVTSGTIAAGAISTEKLSVGAVQVGASRVLNHAFEDTGDDAPYQHWQLWEEVGASDWDPARPALKGSRSGWVTLSTSASEARISSGVIAVRPGEEWSLSALVASSVAVSTTAVQMIVQTSDKVENLHNPVLTGTRWQVVAEVAPSTVGTTTQGQFQVPPGSTVMCVSFRVGPGGTTGQWSVGVDDVILQPAIVGVQIANGAIRAEQVGAGVIGADNIVAGAITGAQIAGQVVFSSVFTTPDTDDVGNPVGFSTLSQAGYEGRAADRKLRHRLANDSIESYYSGDADLRGLNVTGSAMLDAHTTVGRSRQFRLGVGTEAPGSPPDVTYDYTTVRFDTTTARMYTDQYTSRVHSGFAVFQPTATLFMMTRPHDGRHVVVTWHSPRSLVWTFNTDGTIFSVQSIYGYRVTGYHYDGAHEVWVGEFTGGAWYVWDSYYGKRVPIVPGEADPTLCKRHEDTVPGGTALLTGRYFYLLRRITGQWRARRTRVEPGDLIPDPATPALTLEAIRSIGWAGAVVGTFDYTDGRVRFVLGARGRQSPVRTYDAVTGAQGSNGLEAWPSPVSMRAGMTWAGGAFHDLGDDGTLYRFTGDKWTTAPAGLYIAATYQNHLSGLETDLGQKRYVERRKRASLRVGVPLIPPVTTDPQVPTRWRLYAVEVTSTTTTAPADSLFRLQGGGVATSVILTTVTNTGAAPPAANGFSRSDPARFFSRELWANGTPKVEIRGDGWQNIIPTGAMVMWGGPTSTVDAGWEVADGREVPRTGDYAALWAKHGQYGAPYGRGNGATTFTMPDFRGRFPFGVNPLGTTIGTVLGNTEGSVAGNRERHMLHDHSHSITGAEAGGTIAAGQGTGLAPTAGAFQGHGHGGRTGLASLNNAGDVNTHAYLALYTIVKL